MKRRYFVLALIAAALLVFCACAQSSDFLASPDGAAVEYTVSENVAAPVYSHETGRYSDSFTLTVTAPKGTVVRYTLDGSQPTAQSDIFPAEGLLIKDRSKEKNVLSAIPASEFTAESDHTPEKVNKGTVIRSAACTAASTAASTSVTPPRNLIATISGTGRASALPGLFLSRVSTVTSAALQPASTATNAAASP